MSPSRARIGLGEVRHRRLAPVAHAFAYPTCFLLLPLRSLRHAADPVLARNRRALFGFRDADHGDGRDDSLAWLDELLAREGITDAHGEAWLHCIPRMFGLALKPVSFWYAHRVDGTLAAIVVEVNNTFGERHCYLLAGEQLGFGRTVEARKVFHVSPFCETRGDYRFRFMRTDLDSREGRGRTAVRVELHVDGALLLVTSVSGRIGPLTRGAVRFALWTLPAMTAVIVARIHWHALKLWLRRLPIVPKPAPPRHAVSRDGAPAGMPPSLREAGATRVSPTSDDATSVKNPA
jgi:hypothetical protein